MLMYYLRVITDASKYGWAGVLTQAHMSIVEGKKVTTDHPVAYVSGLFRGSQLNLGCTDKESICNLHVCKEIVLLLN